MVAQTAEHFGRIDVLHNNAALLDLAFLERDRTAVDTDIEVWDRTMEVNVRGYMVACKHVIPYMRRQGGGSIINTRSEEHTSELQSLMRISSAGVCLKKKHNQYDEKNNNRQ